MKNFFKLMAASSMIFLLFFLQLVSTQPACYISCGKESCLANNPLVCTGCQVGTILINQRCAVSGFQSQPIRILSPNAQNILTTTFLQSDDASKSQVNCSSIRPGQTGVMAFLNITRSKSQTYTFRVPQIIINQPHKFVNLKFNAILFNQRTNPSIKVLVIDQNDHRIFDNIIQANQTAFLCSGATGSQRSSNGFYTTIRMSTETKNILFQISTIQSGDELGVTDIQVFVGNCQLGCATCDGPQSNQCLSCSNLLTYNTAQKTCSLCPLGFYKINFQCNPCPYNCQTCQLNTSLGKPVCTKCQQSIAPNSTIPQCIINNYINQSLTPLKFSDNLGWKSTEVLGNLITVCGIYQLIGGLPLGRGGSSFVKTYTNLPVHSKIWMKFTLFLIDQITGSIYSSSVSVNGKRIFNISQNIDAAIMNTSQCGTQRKEYIQIIVIPDIQDSNSDVTVQILGLGNYFGIRDFVLGVVNLTSIKNCDKVNSNNQCIRCKNGYSLAPQSINNQTSQCIACPSGYYLKNQLCTLCPIYCKTCIPSRNSIVCSSCDQPLKLDTKSGICNDQSDSLYTVGLSQGWANLTSTGWQFYPKLQNKGIDTCGPYSILGSTQIRYRQLNMKKIYSNLPTHQGIILHFYFYQIDDFDGVTNNNNYHTVNFKINNQLIPYKVSTNGYDACGNSTFDSIQKYVLADPKHSSSNLTFQIHGNRTKFGISNLLIFLTNCLDCTKNTVSYSLETIPLYSAEAVPSVTQRGLKSKIIFDDKITINKDLKQLFQVKLVPTSSLLENSPLSQSVNQTNKAKGQNQQYQVLAAQLYANRQLRLFQNLIRDEYTKSAIGNLLAPDSAYSFVSGSENLIKSLKLKTVDTTFTRYDDIYSVVNTEQGSGPKYRSNIKNLINLFRGISILALFIGLLSFFFGLSDKFDDLFVMCQIIFVHVFIQSPWLSATMKLPVGAMNLVQFMAWLPIQGRNSLQNAIIPPDHYQSSPIVYEQYWKDITFARTIYHTIIFIVVMFIFFWLITLIHQLRKPEINQITHIKNQKYFFIQNYFYKLTKSWFPYLDRIMRFTYFTVMWASCLQFIHFSNQPSGFYGWNSALCIVMFVVYFAYPFLGFYYLNNKASFTQDVTFKQKYDGIRIKKGSLIYFIFKYIKWFIIAFIIGQLYDTNPLAALLPLMAIHALDTVFIIIRQPYIDDAGESERIVSRCSKFYWKNYTISHIIQNILFFILQLTMIIMYAVRSSPSNKAVYLNIGYACCVFIIIMFINALVRLAWGLIRQFQVSLDDIKSKEQEIKTQDEADPINFLELYRNQPAPYDDLNNERNQRRRASIDLKIN